MILKKLSANVLVPTYPDDWPFKLYVLNRGDDESSGYRPFTGPGGHLAGEYGYQLYFRDFEREAGRLREFAEEMIGSMRLPAVQRRWRERFDGTCASKA